MLFSEPKIPQYDGDERGRVTLPPFQCSSASRKFLNPELDAPLRVSRCFSALQRAENSSIPITSKPSLWLTFGFSALQRAENSSISRSRRTIRLRLPQVSVLFSEPKIPQSDPVAALAAQIGRFSALQRAENSSIAYGFTVEEVLESFSALQRAENSSIQQDK